MADPDPVTRKLDAIRAELKDCAEPALDFPAMALKAGVATGIANLLLAVVDAILEDHIVDGEVVGLPCRTCRSIARVLQVS